MSAPRQRPTLARMLVAAGDKRAARAPFVLLVVALLASGLISLLLLNASVNQGAFQLARLKRQTTRYTDEEQALQQQVDRDAAPGPLAKRAHELGMVPGGNPAFLEPGGRVRGLPGEATEPPPPPPPTASDAPAPSGTPVGTGTATPLSTIDPSTQARTSGASPSPSTGR